MISAEKKVWSTPKLRILVRLRTEERVLWLCKMDASGSGFGLHHNGCYSSCTGHVRCQEGSGS